MNFSVFRNRLGSWLLAPHLAFGFVVLPGYPPPLPKPVSPEKPTGGSAANVAAVGCEVMVLHALNNGVGIDSRIGSLGQLKKPPFSSYDTYQLLTQSQIALAPGSTTTAALPDGGSVHLTLKEPAKSELHRKVALSIQKANGTLFLPLLEVTTKGNDPFFVAGYHHQKGILVLGIKLVR